MDDERLSASEFRDWLEDWHKTELAKLNAQRSEADGLFNEYVSGKLNQDQANDKWTEYMDRWGDAPFRGPSIEPVGTDEAPNLTKRTGSQSQGRGR